ncbi:MAG: helix-turn-helix domain-containing protein [Thiotrichales bacterium]|nr:MAG: helix-turn-helix domain-containing protein [Thiotrichales bacterium]
MPVTKAHKSATRVRENPDIPLVKAAFAASFRIAMENNGVSAEQYFRKFHLPTSELTDPDALIPEKPFWRLINQVAIAEMIPDFGMQVAQAIPWYKTETLQPLLHGKQPLETVLEKFCDAAGSQSNTSAFKLRVEGDLCWFEHHSEILVKNDIQMENYRLTNMIELVQLAAGRNWKPVFMRMRMDDNKVIRKNRLLEGCAPEFSQERTAIAMPVGLLNANVSIQPAGASGRDNPVDEIGKKSEFIAALNTVISQYILEKDLSIDTIAELAGCSTRTLQRRLKQYQISYTNLLNEARMQYACSNLTFTATKITDIAQQLGYNDTAHFTRAFKRWTGMTPSQYRKANH